MDIKRLSISANWTPEERIKVRDAINEKIHSINIEMQTIKTEEQWNSVRFVEIYRQKSVLEGLLALVRSGTVQVLEHYRFRFSNIVE